MIVISYEYVCDCCSEPIRMPEKMELIATVAKHPPPVPRELYQVGFLHVCKSCHQVARQALLKHRQQLIEERVKQCLSSKTQ